MFVRIIWKAATNGEQSQTLFECSQICEVRGEDPSKLTLMLGEAGTEIPIDKSEDGDADGVFVMNNEGRTIDCIFRRA